jgi:CheY-like chemotaxis protein
MSSKLQRRDEMDDFQVDLILMDFEMPGEGFSSFKKAMMYELLEFYATVKKGPEACAELRRLGLETMVIGVTGNVLKADIDHYISAGAQSVVAKPFSLVKLMDVLKGLHCVSLGKKVL